MEKLKSSDTLDRQILDDKYDKTISVMYGNIMLPNLARRTCGNRRPDQREVIWITLVVKRHNPDYSATALRVNKIQIINASRDILC
jgi:hypothetical protein